MSAPPSQRRTPPLEEQLVTETRMLREAARDIARILEGIAADIKTLAKRPD
jgi:hypothetical protein